MGTVLAGLLTYIVKIRVSNDELRGALGISISVSNSALFCLNGAFFREPNIL